MEIWIRLIAVFFFYGMLRCERSPNAPLTVPDGNEFSVPFLSRYITPDDLLRLGIFFFFLLSHF